MCSQSVNTDVWILCDNREPQQLIEFLRRQGLMVRVGVLPIGDFVVSDDVVVERKTVDDLINSIIDQRLFQQVERMLDNFPRAILIIEGVLEDALAKRRINEGSVYSTLSSLVLNGSVSVIMSESMYDTSRFLYYLAKKSQYNEMRIPWINKEKQKKLTDSEYLRGVVEALPGIGPSTAINLLREFSTLENLFSASYEQLLRVEGIGEKRAERLYKLFRKSYLPSEDRHGRR